MAFVGSLYNHFSGGKLFRWFDSLDDEDLELPDSWDEFTEKRHKSTTLQNAITIGLRDPTKMKDSLTPFSYEKVEDPGDVIAVCVAAREILDSPDFTFESALPLFGLFENFGSSEAFQIFREYGAPSVLEFYRAHKDSADSEKLISLLKTFGGFLYEPGFDELVDAAQDPRFYDNYYWISIMEGLDVEIDGAADLKKRFSQNIPKGFAGIAFIDWANSAMQEETRSLATHPFDSEKGLFELGKIIDARDLEKYSYAGSAVVALALMKTEAAIPLLKKASSHPDPDVIVEAFWALAKHGVEDGFLGLKQECLNWKTGAKAMRYLEELEWSDLIPEEATESKTKALYEAAEWLSHPNELAKYPDTLENHDHRTLVWPPTNDTRDIYLIKWTSDDDSGLCLVGSVTWCFFSRTDIGEPILDVYARHCEWELSANEDSRAPEESDESLALGQKLLKEANSSASWERSSDT